MFDFTYELEQLEENGHSPELLKRIIEKHMPRAKVMKALYDRFTTTDLPIKRRVLDDPMKINNQINNDFFGEIINAKVGYFSGSPASYVSKVAAVNDYIQNFSARNRLADVDAETTLWSSVTGYAARLIYTDRDGKERSVITPSYEMVILGENGMDEPDYAVRYFTVETGDGEEFRVEFFDNEGITEYRGSSESDLKEYGYTPHIFDYCPVIGYMNNDQLLGDAEKVLPLVDAYDRGVSDVNSELEAFRSAYLALYGIDPPEEGDDPNFAQAGTLYFPSGMDGKQGKAEFVTKVIQDNAIENHLNRLAKDIYKFSFTPDMSDEAFGGNVSGIAMRYKVLALENKVVAFERKFKSANIRMFEILGSAQSKKNLNIDPYEIEQKFKRNFPQDLLYEAQASMALKGIVSEETRLSKLSFVEDVDAELKALQAEQDVYAETLGGENVGFGEVRKKTNEPAE